MIPPVLSSLSSRSAPDRHDPLSGTRDEFGSIFAEFLLLPVPGQQDASPAPDAIVDAGRDDSKADAALESPPDGWNGDPSPPAQMGQIPVQSDGSAGPQAALLPWLAPTIAPTTAPLIAPADATTNALAVAPANAPMHVVAVPAFAPTNAPASRGGDIEPGPDPLVATTAPASRGGDIAPEPDPLIATNAPAFRADATEPEPGPLFAGPSVPPLPKAGAIPASVSGPVARQLASPDMPIAGTGIPPMADPPVTASGPAETSQNSAVSAMLEPVHAPIGSAPLPPLPLESNPQPEPQGSKTAAMIAQATHLPPHPEAEAGARMATSVPLPGPAPAQIPLTVPIAVPVTFPVSLPDLATIAMGAGWPPIAPYGDDPQPSLPVPAMPSSMQKSLEHGRNDAKLVASSAPDRALLLSAPAAPVAASAPSLDAQIAPPEPPAPGAPAAVALVQAPGQGFGSAPPVAAAPEIPAQPATAPVAPGDRALLPPAMGSPAPAGWPPAAESAAEPATVSRQGPASLDPIPPEPAPRGRSAELPQAGQAVPAPAAVSGAPTEMPPTAISAAPIADAPDPGAPPDHKAPATSDPAPRPLAATMLHLLQTGPDQPVTLKLSPAELGTLRFEILQRDQGLHLHLSVDQPAALDLLRRQGDQLLAELRQSGFPGATLSFAGSFAGGGGQDAPASQGNPSPAPRQSPDQAPQAAALPPSAARPSAQSTSLDLRL